MLRTLFQWFDTHPNSYWAIAAVPTALWLALTVLPWRRSESPPVSSRWNEILYWFACLATLAAWRWPYWLNADPFNPDESQFIAGAITLTRDPVFWKAVDGTTSGPLNFYSLLPLHWLGLPLDYFSARVTGVLLIWTGILGCYRLLLSWYGVATARLAILPLMSFFATATHADFLHYSSEHVPLALIGLAAWGLFKYYSPTQTRAGFLIGGFLAGMLPWAKLQTTPIATTLLVFAAWRAAFESDFCQSPRIRLGLKLVGVAALPSVIVVAVVGAAGHLDDLYRDYFVQNFSYLDQRWDVLPALRELWRFGLESRNLPAFAGAAAVLVLLAALARRGLTKKYFIGAGLLTCVSIWCVIAPKRPSLHYALLAIVPLGVWAGVAIGELAKQSTRSSSRWPATYAALGALALIFVTRANLGVPVIFGEFADHWRRPRSPAGNIVRALTNRADRLAVWGWMDRVYVESGLPQATRESETFEQIAPSRQQQHYRDRYVADITRTRPAMFIDATGPGAPYFDNRGSSAHEVVPALAEFVQSNYRLLTDLGYARIFVRKDRFPAYSVPDRDLWRMISVSRRNPETRGPASLSPKQLTRKKIQGHSVQMMLPPAEMIWELDGTEREFRLEYGFDPEAIQKGTSNGVEIIVELQAPAGDRRQIFSRTLDPMKRSDDRGNLWSSITLPPFPSGTKLVIRTTPGEFGDNAWDWVYVGQVDFVRAPFFSPDQFPNFFRAPDSIVSEYAGLIENDGEKLLMTHAPTVIQFSLQGTERRWRFDYGFQPGAYSGEGHTDGATFVVELAHASGTASVLFSRKLDPARVDADRGRLHADIALPEFNPGDQITMRIDGGPTISWDWTYITHLQSGVGPTTP